MSAGILPLDAGIVQRDEYGYGTWHELPQYLVQDGPVTIEQARSVLGYEVVKEQSYREYGTLIEGAFHLVRKDHDTVVWPMVGKDYTVIDNGKLLDYLESSLLSKCPNVHIESVGTLWNGQTSFLNIKIDEFQVKGDSSPTVSSMMYANRHGGGCASGCAHSTRIVCSNTPRYAEMQGAINDTLRKFRHTASAEERIKDYMIDLAGIYAGLEMYKRELDRLAEQEVTVEFMEMFLHTLIPVPALAEEESNVRSVSISRNKHEKIQEIFESDQGLNGAAHTRYGLLQAVTNWTDHHATVRGGDAGYVYWDRIWGGKDQVKQKALELLAA